MTKVDIVSGFLGSGKTTLIKKLLKESLGGEKVVLIENEYGEVGIDGGFLKDSGIQITEMNSGCICCTLVGDFITSIGQLMDEYSPDRIIIEPTGVGKLSDVMAAVMKVEETRDLKLNALVTVINVKKFERQFKNFGEFFINQLVHATTVIVSRTQESNEDQIELCMETIQARNEDAAIITTPWDELSGDKILSVMEGRDNLEVKALALKSHAEEEAHHHHHEHGEHEHHHHEHHHHEHEHHHEHQAHSEHEHHHHDHDHEHGEGCSCGCHDHHHADEIFDTWGKETVRTFEKANIEATLAAFAKEDGSFGDVLRSKGMVNTKDGWVYFDYVEGDYELRSGEPDYTGRLVVIGTGLNVELIEKSFGL